MRIHERVLSTCLPGNSSIQVRPESLKKDPQINKMQKKKA